MLQKNNLKLFKKSNKLLMKFNKFTLILNTLENGITSSLKQGKTHSN